MQKGILDYISKLSPILHLILHVINLTNYTFSISTTGICLCLSTITMLMGKKYEVDNNE